MNMKTRGYLINHQLQNTVGDVRRNVVEDETFDYDGYQPKPSK